MQLKTVLFASLAWFTFAAAAPTPINTGITALANASLPRLQLDPGSDSIACSNKNQAVTNAIGKFCAGINARPNVKAEGIVRVMSDDDWTLEDITWGVQILWLCGESPGKADGEATPAGEVSDDACFSTWWNMCALGDEYGGGITAVHGEEGCQEWSKLSIPFVLCLHWTSKLTNSFSPVAIPTLHERQNGHNELYWGPFPPGGEF